MVGTTQNIINAARNYIPDPRTRNKAVRDEEIGRTALPTSQRESFYLKHAATGSVFLYIDPYLYSSTSSLGAAATFAKVFEYDASLQKCTFAGAGDPPIRPAQYKAVLANYEYAAKMPYMYSDSELVEFLPLAISYLNNTYEFSFVYTGTISTFEVTYTTDDQAELIERSLAVVVRKAYLVEQMNRGLGVAFRGPLNTIDSKSQLKVWQDATKQLEDTIALKAMHTRRDSSNSLAEGIDVYTENVT